MQTSDKIAELAAALAKAQGEMSHAAKDRANPAFKARYADLASVLDACRAALAANGIAVIQAVSTAPGWVDVTTRIVHASGEWAECTVGIAPVDGRAHAVGSAITYARRYGLAAMVGVAPDDDDGNAAGVGSTHIRERAPLADAKPFAADVERALKCIGRDYPASLKAAITLAESGADIVAMRSFYEASKKIAAEARGDAIAKEYDRAGSGGFTGD